MTKLTTRKSATREDRSIKLTDTQLVVLSRAAQRQDGAAAMPEGKNEKAAQKLAATLIEQGLVREIRAKPDMPVWRRDEEGRALALIITKLGRTKIDVPAEGRSEDAGSDADVQSSTGKPASVRSERVHPGGAASSPRSSRCWAARRAPASRSWSRPRAGCRTPRAPL